MMHKMARGGYVIPDIRNKQGRHVRVTVEDENTVRVTVQTGTKTAGALIPLRDLRSVVNGPPAR